MLGILEDIRVRTERVMGLGGGGLPALTINTYALLSCNQTLSRLACCRNRLKRRRLDLVVERAMFNDSRTGPEVVSRRYVPLCH